jgi:mRNA interferase RelE/StbE
MKPVRYEAEDAIRTLRRMPRPTAEGIRDTVAAYAADPASQAANVRALKGEPGVLRLRVGDWRVVFEAGSGVAVIRIGPRGGVYD